MTTPRRHGLGLLSPLPIILLSYYLQNEFLVNYFLADGGLEILRLEKSQKHLIH